MARLTQIQVRRGTAAAWATANPVLAAGEIGLDTTNNALRCGDGTTAWLGLLPIAATVPITQQSGAAYTLALADAGTDVECTNASAVTVTIPPNASVPFPVGTVVNLRQYGAGQVAVTAGSGVTVRTPNGAKTARQYSTVSVVKRATDEWIVGGDSSS